MKNLLRWLVLSAMVGVFWMVMAGVIFQSRTIALITFGIAALGTLFYAALFYRVTS